MKTATESRDTVLRQVIRPAYRNLMELLPGVDDPARPEYTDGVLAGLPLLVQSGDDRFEFRPSNDVLWAARSGTQDSLGRPRELWTFVLEAMPGARVPLTRLLGVRVLEEQLSWHAEPGEASLCLDDMEAFRARLTDLAPYLLARLAADRADEQTATRDARRLSEFCKVVEPVEALSVRCELDGQDTGAGSSRAAFGLPPRHGNAMQAIVLWGETAWPPSPPEAERLAQALCDCLEVTAFEAFLALLSADSEESRIRLLQLAGAPTALVGAREALQGADASDDPSAGQVVTIPTSAGETTGEQPSNNGDANLGVDPSAARKTPLYFPDQLTVMGVPIEIRGERGDGPPDGQRKLSVGAGAGKSSNFGGGTDLNQLDSLGMHIVLTFERERLRRAGIEDAGVFRGTGDGYTPLVFDVSTLAAVDQARKASRQVADTFDFLEAQGLNPQAPGFDVMTLAQPGGEELVDRLIELKSSGARARTQDMTWNEWKTARTSELRRFFFLYLVGNLRSDLAGAVPFLCAIRDPVGTMMARELEENATTRKVRIALHEFEVAEELESRGPGRILGPSAGS